MKTVQVQYFALLRERRGLSGESVQTTADTPRGLYDELRSRHGFPLEPDRLRVVINEAFVEWDVPLNEGDEVVFIPPVAGG